MLKISYTSCLGLILSISAQFTLKICVATRNHEKFTKIPNFGGLRYPFLTSLFEGNLLTEGHEILLHKTKVLEAANSEDFVILACTVSIQYSSVTDRQTDGRTDRRPGHGQDARSILLSRVKTEPLLEKNATKT